MAQNFHENPGLRNSMRITENGETHQISNGDKADANSNISYRCSKSKVPNLFFPIKHANVFA